MPSRHPDRCALAKVHPQDLRLARSTPHSVRVAGLAYMRGRIELSCTGSWHGFTHELCFFIFEFGPPGLCRSGLVAKRNGPSQASGAESGDRLLQAAFAQVQFAFQAAVHPISDSAVCAQGIELIALTPDSVEQ